jgi:hypothetical protein
MHYLVIKEEMDRPEFYKSNDPEVVEEFWKHLLEHFLRLPEQAYGLLRITPKQVDEMKLAAMNLGLDEVQPNPTLEDRVMQLENLAQQLSQPMQGATADGLGGNVAPVMPNEAGSGTIDQAPPVMA